MARKYGLSCHSVHLSEHQCQSIQQAPSLKSAEIRWAELIFRHGQSRRWWAYMNEQILMSRYWWADIDEQILMSRYWWADIDEQILMSRYWYADVDEQILMSRYWWADIEVQMLKCRQGQSRLGEDSACFTISTLSNLFQKRPPLQLAILQLCFFCCRCCLLCCNPTTLLLALLQSSSRPSCLVWLLGANT